MSKKWLFVAGGLLIAAVAALFFVFTDEDEEPVMISDGVPVWQEKQPQTLAPQKREDLDEAQQMKLDQYNEQVAANKAALDADPIAQKVPMLFKVKKEMQLETLRWLLHVPQDKILSAFPELADQRDLPIPVRIEIARDLTRGLIKQLEKQGVHAADMPDEFAAARLTPPSSLPTTAK